MVFFHEDINSWNDWSRVFQSIPAFSCLVENILKKENLPISELTHLTPGTNAVFRVGDYVIKIYAPEESGINQSSDLLTELFAIKRAMNLGVTTPKLIANGFIEDKYLFYYIITEYVNATAFSDVVSLLSYDEKVKFSTRLRRITDKLNTSCERFNDIDIVFDVERSRRWDKYTKSFRDERLSYIKICNYDNKVFAHGDLTGDNVLITSQEAICIIDFADSVLAPVFYEHAHVAVELFDLDKGLLSGYFPNYSINELTDICFNGLLIHDFGGDIVTHHIGETVEFTSLADLRNRIKIILSR